MVDLDGLDIAARRARDGSDLGHHAGTVLHGNAHFQEALRGGHPRRRQRPASLGGFGQECRERCAVVRCKRICERADDTLHLSQPFSQSLAIVKRDAAPQLGRAGRDARGILEAAGGQAHERLLVVGMPARQMHER